MFIALQQVDFYRNDKPPSHFTAMAEEMKKIYYLRIITTLLPLANQTHLEL